MKFISYKHNSEPKFGIIDNNLITDLTGKISGADTLKDLISKNGISEAKTYSSANPGNLSVDDIEYLPLIPNPGKIICVGLNYRCLLYTSPSPRDGLLSRMPSSA